MSERAAYSRVYWSVMDDPKFDGIRESPRHFGAWCLLLIVADMAWPAPAFHPPTVPKASIKVLVAAELIDCLSGGRFRVHGLDDERERRSKTASQSAAARWARVSGSDAKAMRSHSEGNARRDETSTRRDETSKADGERTVSYLPSDDHDSLDVYHELTGYRPWGIWSGDAIRGLISEYTDATVNAAMRGEFARNGERKDLLDRLQARLARDAERAKRDRPPRPRSLKRTPEEEAAYQAARRELAGFAPAEEFSA